MPSGTVAIGERMRRSITTEPVPADLVVPGAAVVTKRGQSFVFVKTGDLVFVVRSVTLGPATGDRRAITSGLSGGESIAVRGVMLLEAASEQSR